jgi:class 3 adenylate cyclase
MERQEKSSEKNIYQPKRSPLDIRGEPAKKVAILFTDMKGSSAFYKTRGNQAGRIVIQKLNDMLFPIIRAYNGIIVKTIGDSIMAYFLLPKEALWSSIAMQKRLQKYNKDHSPNEHLLVRIAINYGYGIVEERDVFGDVVNVAGKLISCCDAQQIIVSELFYRETESTPDVSFSPYHVKEKKEQIENINIYKVEWEKTREIEDIHNIYLFSLRMEKSSREAGPSEDIEKILPLIKEDASKLISIVESEVNATFPSSKACLETAHLSPGQR